MVPQPAAKVFSLALAACMCAGSTACTTIRPITTNPSIEAPAQTSDFPHDELDRVLRTFVDKSGRVNYSELSQHSGDLERYFARLASYSPDSHPELFTSINEVLAYWINAYNGAVLTAVTRSYPIASVGDVGIPTMKIGFFVQQRFIFGGMSINLYDLENKIVRDRFRDPRIHFALNCASLGCPRLPQRAFRGSDLESRLDEETRAFFADRRNVRIDHQERKVYLSAILDWYADDFLVWPSERLPDDPSLLDYIALYSGEERLQELHRASDYTIRFNPYDWRLNDRNVSPDDPL